MNHVDFYSLNQILLGSVSSLLRKWLPDGRIVGNEYKARNPMRADEHGNSFSVNMRTGVWKDFSPAAGPDAGGPDLISLYAYINQISNGEAARRLSIGG